MICTFLSLKYCSDFVPFLHISCEANLNTQYMTCAVKYLLKTAFKKRQIFPQGHICSDSPEAIKATW